MTCSASRVLLAVLAIAASAVAEEGHCGGKTATEWAAVLKNSGKKNAPENAQALLALRRIGAGARAAVPTLAAILKAPGFTPNTYGDVADLLASQGTEEALDAFVGCLSTTNAEGRAACLSAVSLEWGGQVMPAKVVTALAKLLSDKDARTAERAAELLVLAREEARTVIPQLLDALIEDPTRVSAAAALAAIGNPACDALKEVDDEMMSVNRRSSAPGINNAAELKDQARKLGEAGRELAACRSAEGKTFEQWKEILTRGRAEERIAAIKAFGAMRADPVFRVEAAAQLLKDPERSVREAGFRSLKSWGGRVKELSPASARAFVEWVAAMPEDDLDSGDGIHWMDLCGTLVTVAGTDAVPTLEKLARQGRWWGVNALGKLGPAAATAAETIASVLVAEPARRPGREWAGDALAAMGPLDAATSEKIGPMLLKALQLFDYEDNSARANALVALRAAATVPPEAEQLLLDLIARDKELLHEKLDRVLALVDRFPARKADFREMFEEVCFGKIGWDIKGLQAAAFLAEVAPDTKGLREFILEKLDHQAGQVSTKADDKDRVDAPKMLWILRGVRALGSRAAKARAKVELALWAEDVRVRDAAKETLAAFK